MKYLYKHIFISSLILFSITTNYCMDENLELKAYEPNTIENIRKERKIFIKNIKRINRIKKQINDRNFHAQCFASYYSKGSAEKILSSFTSDKFKGHSVWTCILLNQHLKNDDDINKIIRYVERCRLRPTPRDIQFGQLKIYEKTWKKMILLDKALSHIEQKIQQTIPTELKRFIKILLIKKAL